MDLFEQELMGPDSKTAIKKKEKTVSAIPVDPDILDLTADAKDEHKKLRTIMKNCPVEFGDKFKLDLLNTKMEPIVIEVVGYALKRASDLTKGEVESMGIGKIPDGMSPFESYREHIEKCGLSGIDESAYLYVITFSYVED
jgi:hypothetical protein